MKRIRIFALVLCVCLLATAFSGCNKDDKLSAEKEQEIKEAYVIYYNEHPEKWEEITQRQHEDITIDDVKIEWYLGTYKGAVVMYISPCGESDETAIGHIYVAGYDIHTSTPSTNLFVYKNGDFFELLEAYESGMLTKQDIEDIARRTNPDGYRNES